MEVRNGHFTSEEPAIRSLNWHHNRCGHTGTPSPARKRSPAARVRSQTVYWLKCPSSSQQSREQSAVDAILQASAPLRSTKKQNRASFNTRYFKPLKRNAKFVQVSLANRYGSTQLLTGGWPSSGLSRVSQVVTASNIREMSTSRGSTTFAWDTE